MNRMAFSPKVWSQNDVSPNNPRFDGCVHNGGLVGVALAKPGGLPTLGLHVRRRAGLEYDLRAALPAGGPRLRGAGVFALCDGCRAFLLAVRDSQSMQLAMQFAVRVADMPVYADDGGLCTDVDDGLSARGRELSGDDVSAVFGNVSNSAGSVHDVLLLQRLLSSDGCVRAGCLWLQFLRDRL